MTKKVLGYLGVLSILVLLTACAQLTQQPIYNVNNQTVPAGLTTAQVENAILVAGASKGWNMQKVRSGLIVGSINVRHHYAQVTIPYSQNSYSVLYKSSSNLNAAGGEIHRNYNKWVILLNRQIMSQLHSAIR